MKWKSAKELEDNKYDLPGNWLKMEYFEALNFLFRFENSLRVFVYIILKNEYKEKWCELSITTDDEADSTINAIARRRITQDKNYAYLGYVLSSQLLHLTSGELIRIITNDKYWKLFKTYFLGNKEIIKNKLDEIGNVRNSLAHFRPIRKGDIELIKQNSIHTLSEIEKTIVDFMSCPDVVPTNADEEWYKELSVLNSAECFISFKQSKNEQWVKLVLTFCPPNWNRYDFGFAYNVKTMNLKVAHLLNQYKTLTNHSICVTEEIPYTSDKNAENINPKKIIRFTFSRKNISSHFKEIKSQLEEIIRQITNEVELIQNDNLARGKLIEAVDCSIDKQEYYYVLRKRIFVTDIDENSPVEFWGNLSYPNSDFVTDTEQYPWMPVTISEDKGLPF